MSTKQLTYTYPRDCGEKTLYREGAAGPGKPVKTVRYQCHHWENFRSGGHLSLCDSDSSSSSSSSGASGESEDDDTRICDLSLSLYDRTHWHVYHADMICAEAQTRLLGRFTTFEGAEIYARIAFRRDSGNGIFYDGERVDIIVDYSADCDADRDFEIPDADHCESCGTYIIILRAAECHAHSLNPYDDWDQVGRTPLNVKPPAAPKKTKASRDAGGSSAARKKVKKSSV